MQVLITAPITGDDALAFQACFAPGVIAVEKDKKGVLVARVANRYSSPNISRKTFAN